MSLRICVNSFNSARVSSDNENAVFYSQHGNRVELPSPQPSSMMTTPSPNLPLEKSASSFLPHQHPLTSRTYTFIFTFYSNQLFSSRRNRIMRRLSLLKKLEHRSTWGGKFRVVDRTTNKGLLVF